MKLGINNVADKTIKQVKDRVQAKEGIPREKQFLLLTGQRLEDSKRVGDDRVQKDSTAAFKRRLPGDHMLFVKSMTGQMITLDYNKKMKVIDLKEQVHTTIGLPILQQKLLFAGKSLEDGKTLDDYAIVNESTVNLMSLMKGGGQVLVRLLTGKTITIDIEMSETVLTLKKKIHEKEGMPGIQQKLIYGPVQLTDTQTLASAGIQHQSIITLIYILK